MSLGHMLQLMLEKAAKREGSNLLTALKSLLASGLRDNDWSDQSGRINDLQITIWVRWVAGIGWLIVNNYRPELHDPSYIPNNLLGFGVILFNAWVHYQLRTKRSVPWQCVLLLSIADLTAISWGLHNAYGFYNGHYVLYYPALAIFSVLFSSFIACLACGVVVSLVYAGISIASVPNYTLEGNDETTLLVRILSMFVVIAAVNLVARYERFRRREAVLQALELERQRVELSRTIHDTVAQTTYMISIGIENAKNMVDESEKKLISSLDATHSLAQTVLWEVQAPIEGGPLFRGSQLTTVLKTHANTFGEIASIPVNLTVSGEEPALSPAVKGLFFSIVHNALTNVIRHSQANSVSISLQFAEDGITMSIADDGIGLPDGYAGRGEGFPSMHSSAEQMGGRLEVTSGQPEQGTTVTCWVPNT